MWKTVQTEQLGQRMRYHVVETHSRIHEHQQALGTQCDLKIIKQGCCQTACTMTGVCNPAQSPFLPAFDIYVLSLSHTANILPGNPLFPPSQNYTATVHGVFHQHPGPVWVPGAVCEPWR